MSKKPTTKKPAPPKGDCVDYDGDGLCGTADKCPFSVDNDSDGDDLCALHCSLTPQAMLNRLEAEKKEREFSTRSSGQDRVEDNRLKTVFQQTFNGKMYTCLRTDPCPEDADNKCTEVKVTPTPKPGKPGECVDFDKDGVCNKIDKCVFSPDNDNDDDDLCEVHCQKVPAGYKAPQKIDLEKEKREVATRASGQARVEDKRSSVFKKEFNGETYICLRTDPCPNDKSNKCKPKKDEDKCKDVNCMPKKQVRLKHVLKKQM